MAKKKSKKDTLKDEVFEEVIIDEGDNNMEDLPRGIQIDTTTDSSGSAANKFSTGGDVTVGKGGDYIKDLID